jgi:hypothetical protein
MSELSGKTDSMDGPSKRVNNARTALMIGWGIALVGTLFYAHPGPFLMVFGGGLFALAYPDAMKDS